MKAHPHCILLEEEYDCPPAVKSLLTAAIVHALEQEGICLPCEISVLLTADEEMRQINLEQRGIDCTTDVLSFPMFPLTPATALDARELDPETGLFPLGDMVISLTRAAAQAEEYGHSLQREVCYLAVHSVLHLLGYDHMDEGEEKRRMRCREEKILALLTLHREQ